MNGGSGAGSGNGARTRVLIADDQEMIRTGFRLILGTQPDLEVIGEAADGAECVELARRLRPDVCLVDIRMPRLDGLEVTRALAGPGVTDPLRVVVVTTFDQDDYAYTALRNGACGFLLKDAASNLLIEAVRSAARGDALVSPAVTIRLLKHLAAQQPPAAPLAHPLSERELDVVRLLAVGRTNQELCDELYLSLGTVKTHLANIKDKLGVRNRVEIAAWAWDTGLVRERQAP
ncbi:response regulator transcription factor [Streptomyces sp. NBC_00576]|uniref:response regulator transcription factor n=1 Tax=Streptomyces sp. NBC_00576 TaxID=2903665 RepID=UPI002E803750|nr:response regulator transcription factor [Streptomyces sp. NBC_00576]WUB70460.1 response regulator transcription factor [Streptomyces sp. NBC_00576]